MGMSKILPGLYLGSFKDARDRDQLASNNVTHVVSVHDHAKPILPELTYYCIVASDRADQDLLPYFADVNDFIHEARLANGGVLVHCLLGVSRSVTLVSAYLMTLSHIGWRDALNAVRGSRRNANPNLGFKKQLRIFESEQLEDQERPRFRAKYPIVADPYDDLKEIQQLLAQYHRYIYLGDKLEQEEEAWLVNRLSAAAKISPPFRRLEPSTPARITPGTAVGTAVNLDRTALPSAISSLSNGAAKPLATTPAVTDDISVPNRSSHYWLKESQPQRFTTASSHSRSTPVIADPSSAQQCQVTTPTPAPTPTNQDTNHNHTPVTPGTISATYNQKPTPASPTLLSWTTDRHTANSFIATPVAPVVANKPTLPPTPANSITNTITNTTTTTTPTTTSTGKPTPATVLANNRTVERTPASRSSASPASFLKSRMVVRTPAAEPTDRNLLHSIFGKDRGRGPLGGSKKAGNQATKAKSDTTCKPSAATPSSVSAGGHLMPAAATAMTTDHKPSPMSNGLSNGDHHPNGIVGGDRPPPASILKSSSPPFVTAGSDPYPAATESKERYQGRRPVGPDAMTPEERDHWLKDRVRETGLSSPVQRDPRDAKLGAGGAGTESLGRINGSHGFTSSDRIVGPVPTTPRAETRRNRTTVLPFGKPPPLPTCPPPPLDEEIPLIDSVEPPENLWHGSQVLFDNKYIYTGQSIRKLSQAGSVVFGPVVKDGKQGLEVVSGGTLKGNEAMDAPLAMHRSTVGQF